MNAPHAIPDRFDVAVIGGGLAGLAAAATAARDGRSVVLFEGASVPGGRARTRVEDGYAFNIGPHALFQGGASLRLLRDLGVEVRTAKVGGSGALAVKDGCAHDLPAGLGTLLATSLLDWRGKLELAMFLGSVGKMDARPLDGLTIRDWLDRAVRSPEARQIVEVAIRTALYADAPDQVSAGVGLRQLQTALTGALYVDGGWQTIVDDLRARAEAFGAWIVDGARVAEIEVEAPSTVRGGGGQTVRGARLADGRRFEVGAAILAVPPKNASQLVAGGGQETLAAWAQRAVPIRAASLDVGLRRLPRPKEWFALGLDRPLYLSVHSKWAQLAPEGGALVHVLRYLAPSERGDAETERELEALLDLVQPGWQDEVVTRRYMPDLTVVGALPSVAWERSEGPRGAAVPDVQALFVAGDWVGPEGMLADRALTSGVRAGHEAAQSALEPRPFGLTVPTSGPASVPAGSVPVAVGEVA